MSDVLSQNEIDALLTGVDDGRVGQGGTQPPPEGEVELYDLTSGIHRVQGWSDDIRIVDERIQSNLSIALLGLLHKSVHVKRQDARTMKYSDYVKTLPLPTSVNTYTLSGLSGVTALVLDAPLVYALVNIFFGGGARNSAISGREFTQTEQRVIQLTLKTIIDAIKTGWKALSKVNFELMETEMNPSAISSYSAVDVLMIRSFRIEFEGGGGEVQLLMPGSTIDALFRNKTRAVLGQRESEAILRERTYGFTMDVSGELRGASLPIRELFNLAEGDIIPIDSPEQVDVKVNGVTKFKARMGEVNGKVGLKILY